MKIRKAVIAAAGMGTRFLPQTKAMPKEMLPIIDKPIIQIIVEELVEAGVEDIIIVTGYHKRAIEDHFDTPGGDLLQVLENGSPAKQKMLKELEDIANLANFIYLRQKGPLGNATPILNAEHIVGDEPFIYTFGDDFIKATPGRFSQLVKLYEKTESHILTCIDALDDSAYERYAFVRGTNKVENALEVTQITEKPGKDNAPSSLASVSSYVFNSSIFSRIRENLKTFDQTAEFLLQPVIQLMIDRGEKVLAYQIADAKYYDGGNKLDYLKSVVDFGLEHPKIGEDFHAYLESLLK